MAAAYKVTLTLTYNLSLDMHGPGQSQPRYAWSRSTPILKIKVMGQTVLLVHKV